MCIICGGWMDTNNTALCNSCREDEYRAEAAKKAAKAKEKQ